MANRIRRNGFISALEVALPEALGYLSVYIYIKINNGQRIETPAKHIYRYCGQNINKCWPAIYYKGDYNPNTRIPIQITDNLNTSCFKVEMEFQKGMCGEYFFEVIGWKGFNETHYYTETRYFCIGEH